MDLIEEFKKENPKHGEWSDGFYFMKYSQWLEKRIEKIKTEIEKAVIALRTTL